MTTLATTEIERKQQADLVTFRLCGTFDARAAIQLRKALKDEANARVVIDFSGIHEFVEVGIAVLSGGLLNRSIELRGLGRRQAALFRYFRIDMKREEDRQSHQAAPAMAG